MAQSDIEIAGRHLGKSSSYSDQYDESLLVVVPREFNRSQYGIVDSDFVGFDFWNCYEFSTIGSNGVPIVGRLTISYPSNTKSIVESKSLKLYLNSFNMTDFNVNEEQMTLPSLIEEVITSDLSLLLDCQEVQVNFHDTLSRKWKIVDEFDMDEHFWMGRTPINLDAYSTPELGFKRISFDKESPSLLKGVKLGEHRLGTNNFFVKSQLLRSNCKITGQPDWGDLYIAYKGEKLVQFSSLLQYILSFRQENHFHEEVVEMIYKRIMDTFHPDHLFVGAQYTRRGGIDINPFRASSSEYLPTRLREGFFLAKNPRQ